MSERVSLMEEIRQGGYEASVFTTFNAYLPFYEDVVLRKLVTSGARHNIIIMDDNQFAQSVADNPPQFAGRHYSLIPVKAKGAFHPKIILLLGKKKGSLFVGSHNLTLSGFGFNREITNLVRMRGSEDTEAINLLSLALNSIQEWINWQEDRLPKHLVEMLSKVEGFAPWLKKEVSSEKTNISLISAGPEKPSLWRQFSDQIGGRVKRVMVSGAFFDNDLDFIKQVRKDLDPDEFFVGIDPDTVQMPYTLTGMADVHFVNCGQLGFTGDGEKKTSGYLHAKSILAETEDGTIYLATGSANPSRPAWLRNDINGNIEMMLVRMGSAAEAAARELGLLDLPEMPKLTDADWVTVKENAQRLEEGGDKENPKMGIAIAADEWITFRTELPDLPEKLDCGILDQGKVLRESVCANLVKRDYRIHMDEDSKKFIPYYVSCLIGNKKLLYLVHDQEQIKRYSRTGIQRRLRDALNSLQSSTPDFEALIKCVDKIIFSKSKDSSGSATKFRAREKKNESTDGRDSKEGSSLSVDIDETRKSKKKLRLRVSDDLAYLLDTLIYHLNLGMGIEMPLETVDGKGRSEEEQVGAEDGEDSENELVDDEIAEKTLQLCHSKVHTLVGRMVNQLNEFKKGKVSLDDIVVRLTGVLALLRHLRGFDGKISWIKSGQTSFLKKEREKLLTAVACRLFEGKTSMFGFGEESNALEESDEMARLKGLLLWLAWDVGLVLNLEAPYNESPEKLSERISNNGLLIAVAQLPKDDVVTIDEAQHSIAAFSASDMDWLDSVLTIGKRIAELLSSPENFSFQEKVEAGDLAFHPKMPHMGVRAVFSQEIRNTRLITFDPEDPHVFRSEFIRLTPIKQVLKGNPMRN